MAHNQNRGKFYKALFLCLEFQPVLVVGNGLEDGLVLFVIKGHALIESAENDLGPLGSKPQIQTPTKQSKRALGDEDAQNLDDNAPALKRGKLASKKVK